jgi:hypothetical protein
MRILIFCATLLGVSSSAFANDGSVPYIKVDRVEAPLKFGSTMTFAGGEAYKIYDLLPRNFVYNVSRAVTVTSSKGSIAIDCQQAAVNENQPDVGDPKTTTCTVRFDKAYDPSTAEEDNFDWAPSCKEQ